MSLSFRLKITSIYNKFITKEKIYRVEITDSNEFNTNRKY